MRSLTRSLWAAALLAAPLAVFAADPPAPPGAPKAKGPPPVISSHQINRYAAIHQLQNKLEADPKSLSDWIILGELAHEVAIQGPTEQAPRYFAIAREAYEKALALAPDNPGLKAAAQFARDQEANAEKFDQTRGQATTTYLEARRRDLAATNYSPAVPVYGPLVMTTTSTTPVPRALVPPTDTAPAVTPATAGTVSTDTANYGTSQLYSYSYPRYQSFYATLPYTYQQYSNAYYPSSYYNNPAAQPVTLQRYVQQFPRAMMNSAGPGR
jgi:hypothetical protein